jgi:peptidoglycan/xylan/chitin deacetylase (PgdA/CDA1 family)
MMPRLSGFLLRALAGAMSPGGRHARLSILIYHRVMARQDALNSWDVTAEVFEAQMRVIAESFTALPVSEAVDRLRAGGLPSRSVCITFDDGYLDNAEVALPILKRLGLPATFFVATGYLDGGRMWNDTVVEALRVMPGPVLDLQAWGLPVFELDSVSSRRRAIQQILPALKYLPSAEREARAGQLAADAGLSAAKGPMMGEAHVGALRAAGMEIGAHSVTHPILSRTTPELARREIDESGQRLGEILRERIRLFAYPNGKPGQDYGPEHVRMVRDAGYSAAVSTAWGVASAGADVYQLPRFTPWDRTPGRFALRLLGNTRSSRDVAVA